MTVTLEPKLEAAPTQHRPPTRPRSRPVAGLVWTYAILGFGALLVVLPLLLILLNSLKNSTDAANVELSPPKTYHFGNYVDVIQRGGVLRAMYSGAVISFSAIVIVVVTSSSAAYVLTRSRSRWAPVIRGGLAIGLIAPLQVIPEIKVIQTLHLSGSYLAVILIEAATWIPFATFLYSGFIRSLPSELEEAAVIDGCGPIMVWLRIVLPLLKPATSTLVVLLFTGIWNDFQIPLYFINDQSKYTMPLTLFNFSGLHTADYNLLCADIVMTIVPVMIVFFVAQKYIISGLVDGATK